MNTRKKADAEDFNVMAINALINFDKVIRNLDVTEVNTTIMSAWTAAMPLISFALGIKMAEILMNKKAKDARAKD